MADTPGHTEELHPPFSSSEVAEFKAAKARVTGILVDGLTNGRLVQSFQRVHNDLVSIH